MNRKQSLGAMIMSSYVVNDTCNQKVDGTFNLIDWTDFALSPLKAGRIVT